MWSKNSMARNASAAPTPAAMSVVEFCPLTRRTLVVASGFPERLDEVLAPIEDPALGRVRDLLELRLVRFAEEDRENRHLAVQAELLHALPQVSYRRTLVGLAVGHQDHGREITLQVPPRLE